MNYSQKIKREVSVLTRWSVLLICLFVQSNCGRTQIEDNDLIKPRILLSVEYLDRYPLEDQPRLILNKEREKLLREKLITDPVIKNLYQALTLNAIKIQKEPLLEHKMVGRRLLSTSRDMLYRMNVLGMVYRIERNADILTRINKEVRAVCQFTDWNPDHFLDVAEMAMAVSLALDWTAGDLQPETIDLAKTALIEKGILPSYEAAEYNWWIDGDNNWNQVCHAGMIAAALTIWEDDPELATRTIQRGVNSLSYGLAEYSPHGVYPEGSTYWEYGTSFTVLTSAMLESAVGTDFGISTYPGFMESSVFRLLSVGPSGSYYNFADCGDQRSGGGDLILAWFASKTGNTALFEEDRFLQPANQMGILPRYAGAALVWISQYEPGTTELQPLSWKGDGRNPVVFFHGGPDDPHRFYFGGKGGRASINHGNMDAGSFVFELDGIRWVVDPGNQPYHELERIGFKLWYSCQECDRWKLLTKNNFGHSTLTVNGDLHVADGFAPIIHFESGELPDAQVDLSPVFGTSLNSAIRRFKKESPNSLLIEDEIVINSKTEQITWQLLTKAEVTVKPGGAILQQEGRTLNLEVLSSPGVPVSVVSLDPPPLDIDRRITGLKRIEIHFPAKVFYDSGSSGRISVRLSGG